MPTLVPTLGTAFQSTYRCTNFPAVYEAHRSAIYATIGAANKATLWSAKCCSFGAAFMSAFVSAVESALGTTK